MSFLQEYNIDAYDFLGVEDSCQDMKIIRKAYKEKCLVLHPDKTNGRTEVEFKILNKCYVYAKKNIIKIQNDHETMKNQSINNKHSNYNEFIPKDKSVFRLFETDRDLLFHDDSLPKDFEKTIERVSKMSTTYSPIDVYDSRFKRYMTREGKFDREKFNALFSELKKNTSNTQVDNYRGPVAHNELSNHVKVNIDENGIVLNSSENTSLVKEEVIPQSTIDRLLELDSKKIDALIKENKKNTGKISRKKFKEATSRAKYTPSINETRPFGELVKEMKYRYMKSLQSEKMEQCKYVKTMENRKKIEHEKRKLI